MTDVIHPRSLKCLGVIAASLVAALALASSASAATTLSATVGGAQLGTTTTPQPVIAALNTVIDNDGASPVSNPVAQTASIAQTFPGEFANQLASFGSCPETSYDDPKTAPGGPEDPSVSCPANSLVGNGSMKLVANVGALSPALSERVVIVKDATTGGLAFWTAWKAGGQQFSRIVRGTVSTDGAGQTVISWDTTPLQSLAVIRLAEFNPAFNANQAGLVTPEPFSNTGCASGSWAFSEVVTYVGGAPAPQTVTASASCTNLTLPVGAAKIAAGSAKVSKKGKGKVKVQCSTAGACQGTFKMRATKPKSDTKFVVATGKYSLTAGGSKEVAFTLTAQGRKLLESKTTGILKTGFKLTSAEGTPTSRKVTLKAG